ncbi:uncharacterized protein LOC144615744 isoform X2 [Panthera onca]
MYGALTTDACRSLTVSSTLDTGAETQAICIHTRPIIIQRNSGKEKQGRHEACFTWRPNAGQLWCRRDHTAETRAQVTVCYKHILHSASKASLLSRLPHRCLQKHPRLGEFNDTSSCMGHRISGPKFLQFFLFKRQYLRWKEGTNLTPLSSGTAPVINIAPS